MKAAVCIPVYVNRPELIPIVESCVSSVRRHFPQGRIFIRDDASPMDHPWAGEASNEKNLGFTGNVNLLLSEAFGSGADVAVVLNDDVEIGPGDLGPFLELSGERILSVQDSAGTPDLSFGCCWGLTREAWEKLGPLDARFRDYFSDREYLERALAAGVRVSKRADIVVSHRESATYAYAGKEEKFANDLKAWNESR